MRVLKCPHCGAPIKKGQERCEYCGYYLEWHYGLTRTKIVANRRALGKIKKRKPVDLRPYRKEKEEIYVSNVPNAINILVYIGVVIISILVMNAALYYSFENLTFTYVNSTPALWEVIEQAKNMLPTINLALLFGGIVFVLFINKDIWRR